MKRIVIALAICCAAVGFSTGRVFAQAEGSGAPVVVPADPLSSPVESAGVLEKLFRSGAIPSALIVTAFMALLVLRARVPWFSEGWRAVWCSAAIGGLSMLVQAIQSGATPNLSMMIVAATTTAALALQPKPPGQIKTGEVTPS